jgi:hypothetical protein
MDGRRITQQILQCQSAGHGDIEDPDEVGKMYETVEAVTADLEVDYVCLRQF